MGAALRQGMRSSLLAFIVISTLSTACAIQTEAIDGDKLVNGEDAHGRWLSAVEIWGCFGVQLTDTHILTAAHCVTKAGSRDITELYSDGFVLTRSTEPGTESWGEPGNSLRGRIREIHIHEEWTGCRSFCPWPLYSVAPRYSDLAIIELEGPLEGPNDRPSGRSGPFAKLDLSGTPIGSDVTLVGNHCQVAVPDTHFFEAHGSTVGFFRNIWGGREEPHEGTIVVSTEGFDARAPAGCHGDSGAPLFRPGPGSKGAEISVGILTGGKATDEESQQVGQSHYIDLAFPANAHFLRSHLPESVFVRSESE